MAERKQSGIFTSWEQVRTRSGLSPKALEALQRAASLGEFSVLANENVGPQVGSELRQQGFLAVVCSLLGMLVYIWIRFELRFGVGATMATLHDVLITLGLFALLGYEFNLTTIAAFLTLIGYSVNDTVVDLRPGAREPAQERARRTLIDAAQPEPQPDAVAHAADRRHDDPGLAHALLVRRRRDPAASRSSCSSASSSAPTRRSTSPARSRCSGRTGSVPDGRFRRKTDEPRGRRAPSARFALSY